MIIDISKELDDDARSWYIHLEQIKLKVIQSRLDKDAYDSEKERKSLVKEKRRILANLEATNGR